MLVMMFVELKLPQILEVDTRNIPNPMHLRRTSIQNMLIHQPRTLLDDPANAAIKQNLLTYANTRNNQAGGLIKYKLNFDL